MTQLTWLVTGCSSGIGEQFIKDVIGRGDKAIATCRGDASRISALADIGAKTYSLDVTAPESSIKSIVSKILEENGNIDVLVNNAGYGEAGLVEEITLDAWHTQFEANFFGVIKVTNALLGHFRSRKKGVIATIGSVLGVAGIAGGAPYSASKYALEGYHDSLKQEIAQFGIKSILFEPGFIKTEVLGSNMKWSKNEIPDYAEMDKDLRAFVAGMRGNESGDLVKSVALMVDVVKGEGKAASKEIPDRLPTGSDSLAGVKQAIQARMTILEEWADVIASVDVDKKET